MIRLLCIVLLIFQVMFVCNNLSARVKEKLFTLNAGGGYVAVRGKNGAAIHIQGNKILYKKFGVSANVGMLTASSPKNRFNTTVSGAYGTVTYYYANAGVCYFIPLVKSKINFTTDVLAGIRKNNSLEMLVNSNKEISVFKDVSAGFGINTGVGMNFKLKKNHLLGAAYRHDFYYDGSNFFLLNWVYEF